MNRRFEVVGDAPLSQGLTIVLLKANPLKQARDNLFRESPMVSIVVPGKNEGKHFYKLTRTLAEQSYPHYELIIVDDGSDDETLLIGRNLERRGFIGLYPVLLGLSARTL